MVAFRNGAIQRYDNCQELTSLAPLIITPGITLSLSGFSQIINQASDFGDPAPGGNNEKLKRLEELKEKQFE